MRLEQPFPFLQLPICGSQRCSVMGLVNPRTPGAAEQRAGRRWCPPVPSEVSSGRGRFAVAGLRQVRTQLCCPAKEYIIGGSVFVGQFWNVSLTVVPNRRSRASAKRATWAPPLADRRPEQRLYLTAGPGDVRSDDVGSVTVQGDPRSVIAHGRPWVCVACRLLDVTERYARVEGRCFPQSLAGESRADARGRWMLQAFWLCWSGWNFGSRCVRR